MTHCNKLQHTGIHCNTLQHTTTHCNTTATQLQHSCNTLQLKSEDTCDVTHPLQHTATHCNTLQLRSEDTRKVTGQSVFVTNFVSQYLVISLWGAFG